MSKFYKEAMKYARGQAYKMAQYNFYKLLAELATIFRLNENQKTITFNIDGEKRVILKRAKIYQQKSWSSHISNSELKDLFANVNYDMIICHHMDEKNKEKFLSECKEYLRERNKTTKIITTGKGSYEFILQE